MLNQFNKHLVSIASSLVDNNQPVTPDVSHIESFANDGRPSTVNFENSPLDVNSMDKLIKLLPTNAASGLDGITALLPRLISLAILESNAKKALYVRYS